MKAFSATRIRNSVLVLIGLLLVAVLANSCASVSAYERERLADPIMAFETDSKENARFTKAMEAREGSTGGNGGAGGGCACN